MLDFISLGFVELRGKGRKQKWFSVAIRGFCHRTESYLFLLPFKIFQSNCNLKAVSRIKVAKCSNFRPLTPLKPGAFLSEL